MSDSPVLLADIHDIEVSIAVRDLESTTRWYQDNLGFKEAFSMDFPEYGTRLRFLELNGVFIELIQDKRWQAMYRPDPPGHTILQGVSQIRFNVKPIEAVVERVKARPDIRIACDLFEVGAIGFKHFFIRDNEGNIIHFAERFAPPKRPA